MKEVLEEFEGRIDTEVRRQEKIDRAEKRVTREVYGKDVVWVGQWKI